MSTRKKVSAGEIRFAFLNNLSLLGYPHATASTNSTTASAGSTATGSRKKRLLYGPEMFTATNQHGFNAILYFLLVRLNPEHYKQLFDTCWPVYDANQQREFRKIMLNELSTFENESKIPKGLAQASLMANPKGARADRLAWHLSTHVLRETMAQDQNSVASTAMNLLPTVHPNFAHLSIPAQKVQLRRLIRATEAQAAYREHEFKTLVAATASKQSNMRAQATALTKESRLREHVQP